MKKKNSLLDTLATGIPDADRRFFRKTDDVAARIIELMKQHGLTQRDLADRLDKPESYVSRVLGGGANLTLKTITAFESALGADILVSTSPKRDMARRHSHFSKAPQVVALPAEKAIGGVCVSEDGSLTFTVTDRYPVPVSSRMPEDAPRTGQTQVRDEEIACSS